MRGRVFAQRTSGFGKGNLRMLCRTRRSRTPAGCQRHQKRRTVADLKIRHYKGGEALGGGPEDVEFLGEGGEVLVAGG
jgi:hypothetical protein